MRIIAGQYGGRRLLVPRGRDIRPTSDKVRGAIFNALVSRGAVQGAWVLDGFCGTGALGLEALSRGALHCTFIDSNRTSLDLARANAQALGAISESGFFLKDVTKLGSRPDNLQPFGLIFLDPPYNKELLALALKALSDNSWLKNSAVIVAEVEKSYRTEIEKPYIIINERTHGETKILFLSYENTPV